MSEFIFIFGIGNPGREYLWTRHNYGFMAADSFAVKGGFTGFSQKKSYSIAEAEINGKTVYLIKPLTFMNLSGKAVKEVLNKHGVHALPEKEDGSNVIVLHDDLDLQFGTFKMRFGGSGGSHNGVNSIINSLQSKNFTRLKLGINSIERNKFDSGADFVLSRFSKEEAERLPNILSTIDELLSSFIIHGLQKTMNDFNGKNV